MIRKDTFDSKGEQNRMLSNFIMALEAVLPIFMIMGIGMLIRRKGLVDAHDVKKMNQTVFMVFFPVLMFSNLYGKDIRGSIEGKLMTFGVLAVLSVYALTVAVVMRLRKDPKTRGAMIQAIFRSNFVIMGISIVSNIFGGDELILPSVMITVIVPIYNVLAVVTLEVFRGSKPNFAHVLKQIASNPMLLGAVAGIFAVLIDLRLPQVLEGMVSSMAGVATPMALLTLGAFFDFQSIANRKKDIAICVIGRLAVVPAIGLTVGILLGFRATPLTAPDIWLLSSVRDIIEIYMSQPVLILLMLGIAALIGVIVLLWLRAKKTRPSYYFAAVQVLLCGVILAGFTVAFLRSGTLASHFPNLPDAYDSNGFAYCFSASAVTQGISEPDGYSQEAIDVLLSEQDDLPADRVRTPNFIFVQLESFFDANYLKDLTYGENPVPNFERLKETCSSGLFYVPSIGAGTANTEFEVLSGMNLDHFGVGEYPYKTVVKNRTCESMAYALQSAGYSTHAIHNNNATFYSRDRVYANFGFETFTSLEYMHDVERNPLGWAKDFVLTEEILKALCSTEDRDLVFTVSVQPHGKYPTAPLEGARTIRVTGEEAESRRAGLEYYLYQLKQTDAFVARLVRRLSTFSEPTVVVFYGDHLPSFGITQDELSCGTVQSTEYVIWTNFHAKKTDRDVQAYQLAAMVLDRFGIHDGTILRYHQSHGYDETGSETFQNGLCMLEYDMLYGKHYATGGEMAVQPMELHFGVDEITLTGVSSSDGGLTVHGTNFTPYSVILVDGEQVPTEYIDEQTLAAADTPLSPGKILSVAQVSATDTLKILSQTPDWIVPAENR